MDLIRSKQAMPKPKPTLALTAGTEYCFYCSSAIVPSEPHSKCGSVVVPISSARRAVKPDVYISTYVRYAGAYQFTTIRKTQEPFDVFSNALDVYNQAKNEWDWVRLIRRGHSDLYAVEMGKK